MITVCEYTHHLLQYVITICDYTPRTTMCNNNMWLEYDHWLQNTLLHCQQKKHTPHTNTSTVCDYIMCLYITYTPNYRHCVLRTRSALIPSKSHDRAHFPPKFNNWDLFFLLRKIRIPYNGKLMVSKWTSSFLPFFFMTLKNSSPVHHFYKCIIKVQTAE